SFQHPFAFGRPPHGQLPLTPNQDLRGRALIPRHRNPTARQAKPLRLLNQYSLEGCLQPRTSQTTGGCQQMTALVPVVGLLFALNRMYPTTARQIINERPLLAAGAGRWLGGLFSKG